MPVKALKTVLFPEEGSPTIPIFMSEQNIGPARESQGGRVKAGE